MVTQGNYDSLKIEIDNIKDDIKEIKNDSKETNKHFREVIDALKENVIRQTEILNNQEAQNKAQFSQVKGEIAELNEKIDNNIDSQNINTNGLFKGIMREIGVAALTILVMYLLYHWGISTEIKH